VQLTKSVPLVFLTASALFCATPAIGIITASGHFALDSSRIWGNATLFDGATVQTDSASSSIALRNGTKLQLAAGSRARVWENRLLVEKGVGQISAAPAYEIEAAGLTIHTATPDARVRVAFNHTVEVASLSGAVRVTTSAGLLLAALPAGRAMLFDPQASNTGVVTRTGCLVYKDGHYILQDENTQEVIELSGPPAITQELQKNTGDRVEITGPVSGTRPAVSIATSAITVSKVTNKSSGGCLSVAAALNAQTEAPANASAASSGSAAPSGSSAPAHTGMSTGAKIGIVAAIAGGGAGAAIALAGKKSSTSP
jgi:hypothetical protein